MTTTQYRLVVADPPWPFKDKLPGAGRGAEKHYSLMTVGDIAAYLQVARFVGELADDCALLLWRVASQVEEAYFVLRSWGFEPKSELVWVKRNKVCPDCVRDPPHGCPRSKDCDGYVYHFGMGRTVRAAHETCVVATRGKVKPLHMSQRSIFFAPVGRHSQKPDEFYRIAAELFAGPRLELFARRNREGWTCVGDDLGVQNAAEQR